MFISFARAASRSAWTAPLGRAAAAATARRARPFHSAAVSQMSFQGPGSEALRGQSCAGLCSRDTPLATKAEIQDALVALPAWELSGDGKALTRHFVAKNFDAAVRFFGRVAEVANVEGHHPDLHLTNYREVRIDLSTHAIGGISKADFILAAKLDAVPVEYSPKWLEKAQQAQQGGQQVQQQ